MDISFLKSKILRFFKSFNNDDQSCLFVFHDVNEFDGTCDPFFDIWRELYMSTMKSVSDDILNLMNGYVKMNAKVWIPDSIVGVILNFHGIYDLNFVSKILPQSIDKTRLVMLSQHMNKVFKLKRIYCGSIDGFRANNFHENCDDKGPTICIIKNEYNTIFGGYTSVTWNSKGKNDDDTAFLFQLYPEPNIFIQRDDNKYNRCIYTQAYHMCGWSTQCDLLIKDECNIISKNMSYAQRGSYTFNDATQLVGGQSLSGYVSFLVKDIEVFQCQF